MKDRSVLFVFVGFLLAVLLLAACSFEIPEKVHVTGNPTYKLVGTGSTDPLYLADHFTKEDVEGALAGGSSFTVREYQYPGEPAMTYLLSMTESSPFSLGTGIISTGTATFAPTDTIDVKALFEPLDDAIGAGAQIDLAEVKLYLYFTNPSGLTNFKLKLETSTDNGGIWTTITDPSPGDGYVAVSGTEAAPNFASSGLTSELPVQVTPIDLAQAFIDSRSADTPLKFQVTAMVSGSTDVSAFANMTIVIKLPLSFVVTPDNPGDPAFLNLDEALYDDVDNKEDLFNRSEDDDDEVFEYLENISLHIGYTNDLTTTGATLLITPVGRDPIEIELQGGGGSSVFARSKDDIKDPFIPELKLRIPPTEPDNKNLLTVKRQAAGRVTSFEITSMSITARMAIDKTEDL
jgi:hypothetical protein